MRALMMTRTDSICDDNESKSNEAWSTLSDSVRYDLDNPTIDEFYGAMETEALITIYKGTEFFDSIEPSIISPAWFCHQPKHWLYRWAKTNSFWASTVFWDTIVHFIASPAPPLLRRILRCRRPITVPTHPRLWMLLTSCLVMMGLDVF
jgi:hypothetical protein